MSARPPFGLFILDGLAHNPNTKGNAVYAAKKPTLEKIWKECPYTELATFGERVGLPDDQMGNSEVGHLNIGAGRVVEQDLLRINRAVRSRTLRNIPAFQTVIQSVKQNHSALHLLGLCSIGGVHSSMEHLYGLMEEALIGGCPKVYVHVITDGRDRPQTASLEEVRELNERVEQLRANFPKQEIAVADLVGRYYAMDRDKRWERTSLAYELFCRGTGEVHPGIIEAINSRIALGESDEFYKPCKIEPPKGYRATNIQNGDSILCFNFRADRMRQIVSVFLGQEIKDAVLPDRVKLGSLVTLTDYGDFPVETLFPPVNLTNHFGSVVSQAGLRQIRMAETEKYPHVTYFFNGGVEEPFPGEERLVVPSPRDVATYDLKPEMSANLLTEQLLGKLDSKQFDLFVVNYANCDMVGHTGVFDAAVKAVETVDACLGRVLKKFEELGGSALITADHGNADQMVDYETGAPHTYHTKHPVPLVLFGPLGKGVKLGANGSLCDIAPTICELLGLKQPAEMTGKSLIVR